MRYVVDAWDPEYGTANKIGGRRQSSADAERDVDPNVETQATDWVPIPTTGKDRLSSVAFVDGVRRVDARIWIDGADGLHLGVCASVAAGSVRCNGSAVVEDVRVERALHTTSASAEPLKLPNPGIGVYELRRLVNTSDDQSSFDDQAYLSIHNHMSLLESEIETNACEAVIFDGPLGLRGASPSTRAVGYIKTQHVQYLSHDLQRIVTELEVGERSPVFKVGEPWSVLSWYLRLPTEGIASHAMAGIVRLEIPDAAGMEQSIERVDSISASLPRFASEAHKQQRAPQNLYPIAGLERFLRHRLGDVAIIDRALRRQSREPLAA